MRCEFCNSEDVQINRMVVQDLQVKKPHWIIRILLFPFKFIAWVLCFPFMLVISLFKPHKYTTKNTIVKYISCRNCGREYKEE